MRSAESESNARSKAPAANDGGPLSCFLLTRQWRDAPSGLELSFWARSEQGAVRVLIRGEQAICFIDRGAHVGSHVPQDVQYERKPLELRAMDGKAVDGLYFRRQRDLLAARRSLKADQISVYESDVKPSDRYLMERFITASFTVEGAQVQREGFVEFVNPVLRAAQFRPRLSTVSLDIETEGLDGALYSIAVSGIGEPTVFVVSAEQLTVSGVNVICCDDERSMLRALFAWLKNADPDLILGWNVVGFDLEFLEKRCQALGLSFDCGRGGERATILPSGGPGGTSVARLPGRVVLDGIEALRAGFWSFESFELENVAQSLLGRGKRIHTERDRVAEITRLYREDRDKLVRYNVEDCILVEDIFDKAELLNFVMRRAELTGLSMDRLGGSVAAFDYLYLPRLHRRGRVAIDLDNVKSGEGSPGGYVIESAPGLYDNVLLLDFKSLYPSIIRTFLIDPLGLVEPGDDPVPGFQGGEFAREGAILPGLIEELWQARDEAKRNGDAPLSQAVKILMNSFYGVLGTTACRFHDSRLASSITRRGHEIIRESQKYIEDSGLEVIYGDTDSLFVLLGGGVSEVDARSRGEALATDLNTWWRQRIRQAFDVECFLELEFETHFLKFLMPTIRGSETGSKKRYAGLVRSAAGKEELVFKGLESVRTDWTPLARRFQRELYRRVFSGEPVEAYIKETLEALMAGQLDDELVYRKRLRRPVSEYKKNVPPHVQAARQLKNPGRWISYVITSAGPQPVTDEIPQPDYAHYRDRQLAAAADGILHFLNTSFDTITDRQLAMFD